MFVSRRDLMRQAVAEAEKQLRIFGFDFKKPIDVFQIIHEIGIELMFQPLEGKPDGFFFPEGGTRKRAGILINSRRPYTRQRYTAAHELCHFFQKDSARVEVISEGCADMPQDKPPEEVFAESFAEHFLMPAELVTHFFRKLSLKKFKLNSEDIYRLSLCMRTSYEATCNHLLHLEFISINQHTSFKKIPPRNIKSIWRQGLGHNDVWPIDQKMNDFILLPIVGDIILIHLAETPSTGFIWDIENNDDEKVLSLECCELNFFEPKDQIGQTGERVFTFEVAKHGKASVHIFLRRPWEKMGAASDVFNLRINSTEKEFIGHYAKDQFLLAA
jgi:predicted secreted protein/Zn-dependent peptidase ImmA (M78 family)